MELNMILALAGGLVIAGLLGVAVLVMKRTAYLGPVKEELQKEKAWLRRGEYNAAMVKGRQNLELLFKLVAEKNGIQLDNTAQAVANAKEEADRQSPNGPKQKKGREKVKKVMTYQQFNRWLSENGYLDRVARWELNQVRVIGNKAVHENYADKDDAWNQYNYLEDLLKTITEKSQNPKKHHERKDGGSNGAAAEQNPKPANKKKSSKGKAKAEQKTEQKVKAKNEPKEEPKSKAKNDQKAEQKSKTKNEQKVEQKSKTKAEAKLEVKVQSEPTFDSPAEPSTEVKKKRRRRKKKPQGAQAEQQAAGVSVEVAEAKNDQKVEQKSKTKAEAKLEAKVQSKPTSEPSTESSAEVKKKRRRRRRKPQAASEQTGSMNTVVPENKNESI